MRAFALTSFETQPAVSEIPTPEAAESEVLVKVAAASINGFDVSVAAGHLKGMMEYEFPVIIGKDFAGTVEAVGAGESSFSAGDRVFGVIMTPALNAGSIAEFVAVPAAPFITRIPEGVSFEQAGATGLAGATAKTALNLLELPSGATLLISGATGGVGAFAVQLAKTSGLNVIATTGSKEDATFVADLGADQVVNYREDIAAQIQGNVDAVLHLAGDAEALAALLIDGGKFASAIAGPPSREGIEFVSIMATPDAATLDTLATSVATGDLVVPIAKSFSLENASGALDSFSNGHTLGKIGVTIL